MSVATETGNESFSFTGDEMAMRDEGNSLRVNAVHLSPVSDESWE